MQWIECVERHNGVWGVRTSGQRQHDSEWHPAEHLGKFAKLPQGTCRRRLTTELSSWSNSSPKAFWAVLGDKRVPTDGQLVFSFQDRGTEYLVPAIVLIRAMFRPLRHLAPMLFHPTSLELVSAPTCADSGFCAELALPTVDERYNEAVATKALFTWLWAYPSAKRMWNSLYQWALQGILGITLPLGTVRAVFHGIARGKRVAVTEMRVMQITTAERSHLEFLPATNVFTLHASAIPTRMPQGSFEKQLMEQRREQAQPLTDAEWDWVRDLFVSEGLCPLRRWEPRATLDGILRKLLTGNSWRSTTYQVGDWRHAATTYRNWKSRGLWEDICGRLIAPPIKNSASPKASRK
jgi:hypothetical protein